MTKDEFHSYLSTFYLPEQGSLKVLQQLANTHPYSSTVQMLYAKSLHASNSIYYEEQLQYTALVASDRRKLYQLIMSTPEQKELTRSATDKAISENINPTKESIETESQRPQDAVDQGIIVEAINSSIQHELSESGTSDLEEIAKELTTTQTEVAERETEKKQQEIPSAQPFNKWLNIVPTDGRDQHKEIGNLVDLFTAGRSDEKKQFFSASKMAAKSLIDDGEIVTETLANIYADQGNYEKAISSYQTLILKFPEKSALFAGRIKELKKLKS